MYRMGFMTSEEARLDDRGSSAQVILSFRSFSWRFWLDGAFAAGIRSTLPEVENSTQN